DAERRPGFFIARAVFGPAGEGSRMSHASLPAALTARQALFVEHYLIDLNGKEAAIRAGYVPGAAKVRAAKLLRCLAVRRAVAPAMAARAARSGIAAE